MYTSILFVDTYILQATAWLMCFGVTVFFDMILMEFIVEFFIAIIYACRKTSQVGAEFGEFLNRMKTIKALS